MGGATNRPGEDQATRTRQVTRRPRMWKVLLHNDDYTTMDFVVHVLVAHFDKSVAEATHVMLQVHRKGKGLAGVYTRDVAETKIEVVTADAREEGFPLKLTMEPE
ncbi:MAG TPA: ATP-dependent Clp protease adaptor ClpS [Acidobacteria bacterium]|nr:ATP-dependent Clp protease adaptor ClpS [Acidobacteriota bacterium]